MSVASAPVANASPIDIRMAAMPDQQCWDKFVAAHTQGSFFHLSGWGKVVRDVYGYEPIYLTARRKGDLVGVLPLVDVKAPLLGRSMISTPFTVGGGPLVEDEDVLDALLSKAVSIGEEAGVKYVECRSNFAAREGWRAKTGVYSGFHIDLIEDEAAQLSAVPRKRRAEIRKAIAAEKEGDLTIRYNGSVDEFYQLYAASLLRLGTPVFPKRFLDAVCAAFGDAIEIAVVEQEGALVAALLSFHFRDSVLPYYAGAGPAARKARAFDFLYWSVMRRATARGAQRFDFGRSKIGSGSYDYKKLWGAVETPLTYQVRLVTADKIANINPNNPKFALLSKLWPRLPLPAANALGPLLAPNFP